MPNGLAFLPNGDAVVSRDINGSQTGITRVHGTPQVHTLAGRTVFLLPLFHPAAALRTPAVKERLEAAFATIPDLLERPLHAEVFLYRITDQGVEPVRKLSEKWGDELKPRYEAPAVVARPLNEGP